MLYPLKFKPIFKEKIWGGDSFKKYLNKNIEAGSKIGESWEISDHFEDTGIISNGELAGKSLHDVLLEHKRALLGTRAYDKYLNRFPLLIKFIDANDRLSVQVHPDDEYADKNEEHESGKTEMWYIVHADPGSKLIGGLARGVTRELFKEKLEKDQLADVLNYIEVKTGDALYIPAGRIHSITPGLIINEVQQNSDVTYRVYDWGRVGFDGKPRELHVEKSIDVIDFSDYSPGVIQAEESSAGQNLISELVNCPYFSVVKYQLTEKMSFESNGESFSIYSVINGKGRLTWDGQDMNLETGESILIPASVKAWTIHPEEKMILIKSNL